MMKQLLQIVGRGVGQVMFQCNAWSGALMLLGILAGSWQMAALAVAGNVTGTLAAWVFGYDKDDIKEGLYGFNATLTGIAAGAFLTLTPASVLIMLVASVVSTVITRLFRMQNCLSGLTAPFIITVWAMLIMCHWLAPSVLLPSASAATSAEPLNILKAFCFGISQVMLQGNNLLTGILFLTGILINSRMNAVYTIGGALLPVPFMLLIESDLSAVNAGLMGYNGVLCAIAVGDKTVQGFAWAAVAVLLSSAMQYAGMKAGVTTLTAPFVLATWIVTYLKKII